MLVVEDMLLLINKSYHESGAFGGSLASDWHRSFLQNVSEYITDGKPISTEQGKIVIKMLSKASVQKYLIEKDFASEEEISSLIETPTYRKPPYQSSIIPREVRYLGANFLGLRFKFNEILMRDIRGLMQNTRQSGNPWFDDEHRIWVVPVSSHNLLAIRKILSVHRFHMDLTTREYLALAQCSVGKASNFVYDDESDAIICNVCDNLILADWIKHVAGGEWM